MLKAVPMRSRFALILSAAAIAAGISWLVFGSQSSAERGESVPAAGTEVREANEAPARTVVLELFTSQGCSSCPPADRLLTELGGEAFGGIIIPLALHVDYWNYIGWSDPFSSAQWSARQNEYARAMSATQIYTPQMVLDGKTQLVGSSETAVRAEIARQLKSHDRARVVIDSFNPHAGDISVSVRVSREAGVASRNLALRVVLFENDLTTPVRRGENSGRTLRNDHVVRWMSNPLPVQDGSDPSPHSITVPAQAEWNRANLGIAAFVQDSTSLEISGAAITGPKKSR